MLGGDSGGVFLENEVRVRVTVLDALQTHFNRPWATEQLDPGFIVTKPSETTPEHWAQCLAVTQEV